GAPAPRRARRCAPVRRTRRRHGRPARRGGAPVPLSVRARRGGAAPAQRLIDSPPIGWSGNTLYPNHLMSEDGGTAVQLSSGEVTFTETKRIVFGRPAGEALREQAEAMGARRVLLIASTSLRKQTDAVARI